MAYISQEKKKELAPNIKNVLTQYGMKGTISIRHHHVLCVTIREGVLDLSKEFDEYDTAEDGNPYGHVNEHWYKKHHRPTFVRLLTDLIDAMKGKDWFDESDITTDYFHIAWYIDINVGTYKKGYIQRMTNPCVKEAA